MTRTATPAYVKFDQNSRGNHAEEFAELELRPLLGLVVTPGFKHVEFQRSIDALQSDDPRRRTAVAHLSQGPAVRDRKLRRHRRDERLRAVREGASGAIAGSLIRRQPEHLDGAAADLDHYQAGVIFHRSRFSLDADGYYIRINNKFQSQTVTLPGGVTDTAYFNEGRVECKELEVQATYALGHGLALFANGSIKRANERGTGNQVPNAPKGTAASGVLYKHGPLKLSVVDKWIGPQYVTSETFVPTTGFNTLKRQVRIAPYNDVILAPTYEWCQFRVGVTMTDALNSRRIENIGLSGTASSPTGLNQTADQIYFQPGRPVRGSVAVRF